MIIEFDNNIENKFINNLYSKQDLILLEDILSKMSKGYFFLRLSQNLLNKINTNSDIYDSLSIKVRHLIHVLYSKYYTIYSEIEKKESLVIIKDISKIEINNSSKELQYNYPFKDIELLDIPFFSTENSMDAKFYLWMYSKQNLTNVNLLNRPFNGANFENLKNYIDDKKFILCISDSDKNFSSSTNGDTAKGIELIYNGVKENKIFYLYVLNVREKENLLPFELYFPFLDKKKKKTVNKLIDLSKNNEDIIAYFDIKSGIKRKVYDKFYNKNNNWNYINKELIDYSKNEGYFNDKAKVNESVIQGIGGNLVEKIQDSNIIVDLKKTTTLQNKDWINIFNLIEHFGICFDKKLYIS